MSVSKIMETDSFLISGPERPRLVLAHGAGAGMDSDFMNTVAELLAFRGVGVVRFEFPYMQIRRQQGTRRPPDRTPVLLEYWRQVVTKLGNPETLYIGGKSMGGRIASMVADELGVRGIVALGYPFHPRGQPEKLRIDHLVELQTPACFFQGSRDPLGTREEVAALELSPAVGFSWLEDGDHDLKPRKKSGFTQQQHLQTVADGIARFIQVGLC